MFKNSARELKSPRCLATAGILIALGIILNMPGLPFSFQIVNFKITFGYLAIAAIGMLFGPVVAMLAAVPFDLIPAMMGTQGVNILFLIPEVLSGLIFGTLLYGYASRVEMKGGVLWATWQVTRVVIARLFTVILCYFVLNNFFIYILYSPPSSQGVPFWIWAFGRNGAKIIVQFPIDMVLMFTVLPILRASYNKIKVVKI
jgi:ECF transporter S component (folate family)